MGRKAWKRKQARKPQADHNNADPAYWNSILKREGLGTKLPPLPKGRPTGKKMVRHATATTWTDNQRRGHSRRMAS